MVTVHTLEQKKWEKLFACRYPSIDSFYSQVNSILTRLLSSPRIYPKLNIFYKSNDLPLL
jgi:hypothetical protein